MGTSTADQLNIPAPSGFAGTVSSIVSKPPARLVNSPAVQAFMSHPEMADVAAHPAVQQLGVRQVAPPNVPLPVLYQHPDVQKFLSHPTVRPLGNHPQVAPLLQQVQL